MEMLSQSLPSGLLGDLEGVFLAFGARPIDCILLYWLCPSTIGAMPSADSEHPPGDVTRLLAQVAQGHTAATQELYDAIYGELHRIARAQMSRGEAGHTLQPTALVHEAWIRLAKVQKNNEYRDREHFFSVAASAMRSALVDQVRRRKAEKRGGEQSRIPIEVAVEFYEQQGVNIIALDEALERLGETEPRQSRVVELRFFGGLNGSEVAKVLNVSRTTVDRDWYLARIWLREELRLGSA